MLALLLIIPLAAVIAIFVGAPARLTALVAAVANLALVIAAAVAYSTVDATVFASSSWTFKAVTAVPNLGNNLPINLHFGFLNGLSVVMAILTALVTFAAIFSGKAPEDKKKLWFSSTLLIAAGAMGAFLSLDLFFFYAFHELALIPTFLMIGILGRGDRKNIAWKATVYLAVGSIVLLAGLIWLAQIAGTFDIATLITNIQAAVATGDESIIQNLTCISALLIIGFGTLVSLFPFHSWAAPAYASAPAPVAMLHSGVLKKFGLYGLIQIAVIAFPAPFAAWLIPLLVLLLCNIIWVGLVTINQKRIDLMLGNSSVMHMGYIFLAIAAYAACKANGIDNEIALPAAGLLMFAHGISIAMSFSLTDVIERKTGTLELNQLGGFAKSAPKLAFLFGLVGMASIGLPGLANFAGEVMVFFSGFKGYDGSSFGPVQWATMIAIWGVVISAVYMLRAFKNTFHGPLVEATRNASDITICEKIPAALLAITLLVVGIYPNIILQFLKF